MNIEPSMARWRYFLGRTVIRLVARVMGLAFLVTLAYRTITLGVKAVWGRTTWPRPAALDDPDLGTHGFVKVGGVFMICSLFSKKGLT